MVWVNFIWGKPLSKTVEINQLIIFMQYGTISLLIGVVSSRIIMSPSTWHESYLLDFYEYENYVNQTV